MFSMAEIKFVNQKIVKTKGSAQSYIRRALEMHKGLKSEQLKLEQTDWGWSVLIDVKAIDIFGHIVL